MTGNEFIKRARKWAKANNKAFRIDTKLGKGSHVAVFVSSNRTIVQDRKKELPLGTFCAMLDQLNINPEDF